MKGSCACGAVEYEIDQLDMPIAHCHCRTCRKAHAAAFAPTARVMRELSLDNGPGEAYSLRIITG